MKIKDSIEYFQKRLNKAVANLEVAEKRNDAKSVAGLKEKIFHFSVAIASMEALKWEAKEIDVSI